MTFISFSQIFDTIYNLKSLEQAFPSNEELYIQRLESRTELQ